MPMPVVTCLLVGGLAAAILGAGVVAGCIITAALLIEFFLPASVGATNDEEVVRPEV